jgi:CheY-like chemotaxis protein
MPNFVISIIDDDPAVREGTIDLLNSAGFVAETFTDADEFLKSGRVDDASCVVADMRMPGMSGLELHDHLLRAGKNIPTILITGFPKETDRARALESACAVTCRSLLAKRTCCRTSAWLFRPGADVTTRRGPFRVARMPPFTHKPGPAADARTGKPQTRLMWRGRFMM